MRLVSLPKFVNRVFFKVYNTSVSAYTHVCVCSHVYKRVLLTFLRMLEKVLFEN